MKVLISSHFIAFFILVGSCTHDAARISMKNYGIYTSDHVGNVAFEDVGPVKGAKYTWIWKGCEDIVTDAIKDMLDQAKALGANTVYNVRFHDGGLPTVVPTCKRQWGWLFFLVPFPASSTVTGMAARIDRSNAKIQGALHLNRGEDSEMVAQEYVKSLLE